MKKKYTYCEKYNSKIQCYLEEKKIKYRIVGDDHIVPKMISFIVYDNVADDINRVLKHSIPIVTNEFSKKELQAAKYLTFRAIKQEVEITNISEAFSFTCPRKLIYSETKYGHKEQIKELVINKKSIANRAVHFFSSANGFSELFIRKEDCELLKKECIKGITFMPVNICKEGKERESGLLQVLSQRKIEKEKLQFNESQTIKKCPICGQQKIVCGQDFQLRIKDSSINYSDDFYMTDAIFGEGLSYPLFIISQKLYNVLYINNMLKNVVVEPVIFNNEMR